jgi:hypothetical protein
MRAPSAGISLTRADAALVKAMLERGDRQSDIASYFGVNGGRIAEISTGHRFGGVTPADEDDLPPPGPYVYGKLRRQMRRDLIAIRQYIDTAELAEATRFISNILRRL